MTPTSVKVCMTVVELPASCIRQMWTQTLCIRWTLCRHVTIGTPMVIFAVLTGFLTVFDQWCTNCHRSTKTVPTVYQQCTNCQKQSKDSKNSKNDHWCTNCHRSKKTVPTVYQSSKTVKNSQTAKNDHSCTNSHMSTQSPPNTQSPHPCPPSASVEYTKLNYHSDTESLFFMAISLGVTKCETKKGQGAVFGPLKSHFTINISKMGSWSIRCQL